jgi:hypothetical protein
LPVKSSVKLLIFDLLGREVGRLIEREMMEGYQEVEWKSSMGTGISTRGGYASGVYFYRLEATATDDSGKRFIDVRKMVLLK